MKPPMYWVGNIAKNRIIGEILDAHPATPITIFDYGCGDGGDWRRVLADRTDIRMVGYEPDQASAKRARERLQWKSTRGMRSRRWSFRRIALSRFPYSNMLSIDESFLPMRSDCWLRLACSI